MDIQGAKGLLINITSGQDITMDEIHEASTLIQSAAHEDANIIWGVVIDENMHEQMAITVVATGFSSKPIVLSSTTEEPVISRTREKQTATVIDYNRPAFMRKKELGGEKEVVRLGMVVDDSILDEDTYNVPTFLRKKAD